MKDTIFIVIALLFCLGYSTRAQNQITKNDTLYSNILQEKRAVIIIYPKNYKPESSEKYDALYVLDGEWNTSLASTVYNFLAYAKFVPENMVIVGIPNPTRDGINLRDRDFTPSHTSYGPVSGGADKFLSFIKNELVPHVTAKHPARKEGATLYGTSLGGLFALYAFLSEPSLFKSYMTVEPSLWWDKGYLNKLAAKKLGEYNKLDNTVWISSRDGMAYVQMGTAGIDSVLRAKAPAGLVWKCESYPNETHFSTIWKGVYDGLKFSYIGHLIEGNILINPLNGIVLKEKPFTVSCYNLAADSLIYYTLDGSQPTQTSGRMTNQKAFTLNSDATLTLRSFSPRTEYNKEKTAKFKTGTILKSIPKPNGINPGGLKYSYYEGDWSEPPVLKRSKPSKAGIAGKDFDINKLSTDKSFVCVQQGYLEITEEGYYIIEMQNPNGTKVFIGDQQVIGNLNTSDFESFLLPLEKGFYPFRLEYFRKKGGNNLQPVFMKTDKKGGYPIPFDALYSRN